MSSRLCEGSCELVPTELKRLKIDRVDLVPEGANSAAFVTLYKGKEMKSMDASEILQKLKPEHAEVIQAELDRLAKERDEANKACERAKKEAAEAQTQSGNPEDEEDETKKAAEGTTSFDEDETLTKSLDPQVAAYIDQLKKQKSAAEEVAKAAIAKERHANAVSKAAELKALPIAADDLVAFIEKSNDETIDVLSAIAKGIESTVLSEQGANTDQTFSKSSSDAWSRIEAEAERVAKERNITVQKATGVVISEQPDLYKEYLEGGAN